MPVSSSTQGCVLGEGGPMTPKKQEGATQGPTLGQRNCLPGPERESLSWPPEREVWKLVSGVARPTGTRHWTTAVSRSGDSA